MKKRSAVIAFIPVIHRGYIDFIKKTGVTSLYLLEASDAPELDYLSREIRALTYEEAKKLLSALGLEVHKFSKHVEELSVSDIELYMPNEDICHSVQERFLKKKNIIFIDTFLRWDWNKTVGFTLAIPEADRIVKKDTKEALEVSKYMGELFKQVNNSSDWWRQISATIVSNENKVITAYNKHLPNEYVPYIDGDPRNNFKPGEHVDLYTSLHGEAATIAEAARKGISLDNAEMYVTTFPCSLCASQIAASGIKKVFFTGGYSNLNGVKTMRDAGVELIYIEQ